MTVYHKQGTDVLYVGGQAVIYMLTFTDKGVQDTKIPVVTNQNAKETCLSKTAWGKLECDNFITVIEEVNGTFVVCGTNAGSPKCWLMNNTVLSEVPKDGRVTAASDIFPRFPSHRSVSISAEGSLYAALSTVDQQQGSIRRVFGSGRLLKTESKWLLNPQFAGAALIPASLEHKEEIYFMFSEVNKTASVDDEPYRARIARVCLADQGGVKNILPDSWTTFLKVRVMCGSGNTAQQYNNIKQAYVLTAQRTGIMYGLFSNAWETTVVCAYSIEDIDRAFSTSKLKGYNNPIIGQRPGTCAVNTTTPPNTKTLEIIRDHPEIEDVIRPIGNAPLDLPTEDHFTHIVMDTALAVNGEHYSVVYIGTEQGKVLKVLHTIDEAFIISEFSPFHNEGPVLSMTKDSQKGHLYVGTSTEIQRVPLADCSRYGDSCRECILSRDPYCGWDRAKRKCLAIPTGYNSSTGALSQNLDHSNASVCGDVKAMKSRATVPKDVVINSKGPVLLPCPVRSYHATYRWEKDNCSKHYPCTISGTSCVLAPTPELPLKEGVFRCMAVEDGFKQEVVSYRLVFNGSPVPVSVASTLSMSVLLAASTLWLL
ncbi:semaphorin-7A [Sardina pilchardus]|uniref:semaphorin-7A n=1 Tax=Sardina pilchardus TaxID=27697 RepID=UPI002E0D6F6B